MNENGRNFPQLVRAVGRQLEKAAEHSGQIVARCRGWLHLLGPLAAPLDATLAALDRAAADAYAQVRPMLADPGDPLALWQAADRWRTTVAAPVGTRVASFTADFVHADDHWRGSAATAYRNTLPSQHAALELTESVAADTADSLRTASAVLAAYWSALISAATGLATSLAVAAAATTAPLTAPAGAALALAALEEFMAAEKVLNHALHRELDQVRRKQFALLGRLTDGTVYPGGHWPVSATDTVADASLSDGDPLDWSLTGP
ncbi:hypothetical protein [Dactylosporangium sp. CA-233914]|uniref:hypothetical protein n=1 Tax=Dactylosporangium sp. CA-233914 TaxID=3239934 RepID=UPI003D8A0F8A